MNNKNDYIKADIFRYFGDKKGKFWFLKALISKELSYIITFRKATFAKNTLTKFLYRTKLKYLTHKTNIQIPLGAKIGIGFCIHPSGSVIINPNTIIGSNVQIYPGINIGMTTRGEKKEHL